MKSAIRLSALAALSAITLTASLPALAEQVFYGPSIRVGDGHARVWVRSVGKGRPDAIGVALSEHALEGLPDQNPEYEYTLPLPSQIRVAPYDHIGLNWNPHGHEPDAVYGLPHFDVHFYMLSSAQQHAIQCMGSDLATCTKAPATELIPPDYIPAAPVPAMGWHWVDSTSPELHGAPFTSTFVYGYYNAQQIFFEPMVSRAFLLSQPDQTLPVKQPEAFSRRGYYPENYRVHYDAQQKTYNISLEDLALHHSGDR